MEDSMTITPLIDMFEEAEQSSMEARDEAFRARDYYDGKQLTDEEIQTLKKRGQPPIVINRIRRKVDWLRGLEMQGRTDPRAFPRTPKHEQGAQAATDAIRYVCDNTDWDKKRSAVWGDILVEGLGGVEVVHHFKPPMREPEIRINRYAYDRLFHDPHSSEPDFSDARYIGAVIWSDADALKKQYPDAADYIDGSLDPADGNSEFEDKPRYKVWSDPKRRRVRQVLVHYREDDVWKWARFVKGGLLEGGESPYVDENGESACALIMQSAYIDRENNRYGMVKDMLDPQDEINMRRSKLLHQLNNRQTIGVKGAVDSVSAMKRELAKPDGHVEINIEAFEDAARAGVKPFDLVPTTDQSAGQFNLLQEAKAEIDMMGANSGLAGKEEGEQSGRAILAKQQGGMIEIAPLTDHLSHFTRAVYRAIWNRIRQFWKEEKWVRITDDERNTRFVTLNRPVTLQEKLEQMPEEQVRQIALQMGLRPGDPRLMQPVEVENNVEELDVDILLEEVPDQVTLQGETFEQIVNIATSQPGSVPPDVLIELAPNLPRDIKDKLIERLEQQMQQQGQAGQAQQQLEAAKAQAEIEETQAHAQERQAGAMKDMADAQRAAMGL